MPRGLPIVGVGMAMSLAMASASALTAADPQQGRAAFAQCRGCHSLQSNQNGIGPTLHGLFGRRAGTMPNYNYSVAMKLSHIVWNYTTLRQYLANPHKMIPGDKMAFAGIQDEGQLENLIAYLQQATR